MNNEANPKATEPMYGMTPMHVAAKNGNVEGMKLLFEHQEKQDWNETSYAHICDVHDLRPLHYAARYGQLKAMQLLLDKGAKIDSLAGLNQTPFHKAAEGGHVDALKLLFRELKRKNPENATAAEDKILNGWDSKGRTPIHYLANTSDVIEERHVQTWKLLSNMGCDPHRADNLQKSAENVWLPKYHAYVEREQKAAKEQSEKNTALHQLIDPDIFTSLLKHIKLPVIHKQNGHGLPVEAQFKIDPIAPIPKAR